MNIQGTYTNKGLALAAKTAAGACLRVTRVVGGSGHTADIPNVAQLLEIRQTLAVGEARCAGDTAVLPVTLAAVELGATYTLTELGIYAEDPNEGEISVLRLPAGRACDHSGRKRHGAAVLPAPDHQR